MSESKLIELGYYDPSAKIRLSAYADTVVLDPDKKGSVICAIRFGGYPEMVRAMADAIYGGATIEATQNDMFYYANTMQAKAMKLMASKLAVAGIIEGTFSEEGLAAMSDVKDMTSQMAKELAAGIRDNVEDIAAAFKKMAIINPNRKNSVQEETDVESLPAPEIVSEPRESSVRTAQTAAIWERYEGLLARTNEEKKKRKSKVAEVDENQLSIFDFAA